jgi:hypothetical protein
MKSTPKKKGYSLRPQRKRKVVSSYLGFEGDDYLFNDDNISDAEEDIKQGRKRYRKKVDRSDYILDQEEFEND